jgi:hypothetical protein
VINDAELASLKAESLRAMPDTATILRPTSVNGPGGQSQTFAPVGTTPCRLTASVLSGGSEQAGASKLVSIMAYMLTVPAGTDINARDRVQVADATFEVLAVKGSASWNMSDSCTLVEIRS